MLKLVNSKINVVYNYWLFISNIVIEALRSTKSIDRYYEQ